MKNLSQFKREIQNYTAELYYNDYFGHGYLKPGDKLYGLKRKVIKKQSNGVYFDGGSYFEFPQASCIRFQTAVTGGQEKTDDSFCTEICLIGDGSFSKVMKHEFNPIN